MDKKETEKTFLIGGATGILFLSIILLADGIIRITDASNELWETIYGIVVTGLSTVFLVYAILYNSKQSRFSPKIRVSNRQIEIKTKVFQKPQIIKWLEVDKIKMDNNRVQLVLKDGENVFPKPLNKKQIKELKQMLREIAEYENVAISGV